jgi:pimeloyl-ACP methyl ester carboxylesterase
MFSLRIAGCGTDKTSPVGDRRPNAFSLYDMIEAHASRRQAEGKLKMILRLLLLLFVVHFTSEWQLCAQEPDSTRNLVQPHIFNLPLKGAGVFGSDINIVTHFYKPEGNGPFPVVIFSHGRSSEVSDRKNLKYPVLVGHANFWLRKGFAVIASVRPGYGQSQGIDREDLGVRWRNGQCIFEPDYASLADVAGKAVFANLDWAREQAWANKEKFILVGVSVGGLATAGVASKSPPGVVGYINFSGGGGGSPTQSPGRSCRPELLAKVFEQFGKTTRVPSLWLYAENDLFWGAEAPKEWHRLFAAGGSKTVFIMTPPVPDTDDGHKLLALGGRLWSPHANTFVKDLGF